MLEPIYLLVATIVILACIICNHVSSKIGIPMLLAFILLGMFFGSDGIAKIPFENYEFAETICSIALIFIMFYGGFGTRWSTARPIAGKAVLLSSFGVILTAGITGVFCHYVLKFALGESLLIGAVISSTDAASVFSILRSKRLNLKNHTAPMLELESGSNDPFSYMLTIIVLSVMQGENNATQFVYMIFAQIAYGVGFGIVIAITTLWVFKKLQFATAGFDAIFVVAVAIMAYAAPAMVGGNGYLSVYIVGIILGNKKLSDKRALVHFFDGITGLMQMLIFFLLGLLSFPSRIPYVVIPALIIAVFITIVARPLSVFLILSPFKCSIRQQLLVSWAGLRGAASIVFSIMVMVGFPHLEHDIFHIVFCIVLFSIAIQGSLIPYVAGKLHMLDEGANVLKTFTDYSEEVPIQFIELSISEKHPWVQKKVQELLLPPETILVLILRNKNRIAPRGNTVILAGDTLVVSAKAFCSADKVNLTEIYLDAENEWLGKPLSQIKLGADKLIVMIQRKNRVIIPKGSTVLKEQDILVMSSTEKVNQATRMEKKHEL